jgi:hypothetical protein
MHPNMKSTNSTCTSRLQGQRRLDQERICVAIQHKVVTRPNEAACQGHCRHATMTCNCEGLHLSDGRAFWRGATQIRNEQGSPSHVARVQGHGKDQARPGQKLHTRAIGTQIGVVATIQGGQGGKQACFLACNLTLHQQHSNLITFLYQVARGPKKPMRGIMEHARGWCK